MRRTGRIFTAAIAVSALLAPTAAIAERPDEGGTADLLEGRLPPAAEGLRAGQATELSNGHTVTPHDGQGVAIEGPSGQIRVTPEAKVPAHAESRDGRIIRDAKGPVDSAIQTTEDGVQLLTIINSIEAPSSYGYRLELPNDVTAELDERGMVRLVRGDDEVVGLVQAPWAVDANGERVETRFDLRGEILTQTVDFDEQTAFPVVADPWISFGFRIYTNFYKSEVQSIVNNYAHWYETGEYIASSVCGEIPHAVAKAACGVAADLAGGSIWSTITDAYWANECFQYGAPYTFPPIPNVNQHSWNVLDC